MRRTVLTHVLVLTTLAVVTVSPRATSAGEPEASERPATYGNTPGDLVPYSRSDEPYRRFYAEPLPHRGPGRDEPDPAGLETVRIGLIAPVEGASPAGPGPELQRGVTLALEEANAAGGYRELPFELVIKNDQALWGSSSNTLVELAYVDRVWALIGSIDSNSTHVALRAALKAELTIVNVGSTDPTMTETGIPWIVRLTPDDRQTSYRLARRVFEERQHSRVAIVRASNRYGRFGVKEFRDAARRLARPVPLEIQFPPGEVDLGPRLDRLTTANVEAIVVWADAADAATIVRQLRERGMTQPVYGTDQLAGDEFLALAGAAAEGVEATTWMDPRPDGPAWTAFRRRYVERFGAEPGPYAAYGYDAARLVVEAIGRSGLNRIRIRDRLMTLRAYDGVAGAVTLDETSNSVSRPLMVRVEEGRRVPL